MSSLLKRLLNLFRGTNHRGEVYQLDVGGTEKRLALEVQWKTDSEMSESIRSRQNWEPDETALIRHVLKKGQCFVDVGANIGYFSIVSASLVGDRGLVLAFEPEPTNFKILTRNIQLNNLSNVFAWQCALADQSTSAELYLSDTNLGDHTLFSDHKPRGHISIKVERGDELILSRTQKVHFLKIDTQGSELHVLRGMPRVLENSAAELAMLVEISPNSLSRAGVDPRELVDLMANLGLDFYLPRGGSLIPINMSQLYHWIEFSKLDKESEGFTNLFCCHGDLLPEAGWPDLQIREIDPFDILICEPLKIWDGSRVSIGDAGEYMYFRSGWDFPNERGICMNAPEALIKFKPVPPMDSGARVALQLKTPPDRDVQNVSLTVSVEGTHLEHSGGKNLSIYLPTSTLTGELLTLRILDHGFSRGGFPLEVCALEFLAV